MRAGRIAAVLTALAVVAAIVVAAVVRYRLFSPHAWAVVDAGPIRFEGPGDLDWTSFGGVDSYCGTLKSSWMKVDFDYGLYLNDLKDKTEWVHQRNARIVGVLARRAESVTSFDPSYRWCTAMYVGSAQNPSRDGNWLHISVMYRSKADLPAANRLLGSVRFTPGHYLSDSPVHSSWLY